MKQPFNLTLKRQILLTLAFVAAAYLFSFLALPPSPGLPFPVRVAWTVGALSFILHPVLPQKLPPHWAGKRGLSLWHGKRGLWTIRFFGLCLILGAWLLA